jgi:hypothetical protein
MVLRPRSEAGPIKHIEHIERIGHSDVDADEATNADIRFFLFRLGGWRVEGSRLQSELTKELSARIGIEQLFAL